MTYPTDIHGTLHVARKQSGGGDEAAYEATFEVYGDDDLVKKARIFYNLESLKGFLHSEVRVSPEATESLISDLGTLGRADVFDLELRTGDLARLGFE